MKKVIFLLLPFLYLFILLFQIDLGMLEDLGRHLKMGEVVLGCRCVPQTNLFSYTNPDFPVVNHEWLTQVMLYWVSQTFGLSGLLVLKMIVLASAFAIVFWLASKKSRLFWVSVVGTLCLTIFSSRFRVRPEMFSYLFIALTMLTLYLAEEKKRRNILWLLPLIQMLWVNMHIYFIFGIMMVGTYIFQQFIITKKLDKFLLLIGLTTCAATLLNPQFIQGVILPFTIFSNYGTSVEENLSIFDVGKYAGGFIFTLSLQIMVFEALFLLFLVLFWIKLKKTEISQTLNALATGIVGVRLVRSISLFGLFGLQPLATKLSEFETILAKHSQHQLINTIKATVFLVVLIVAIAHVKGLSDNKILSFSYQPYSENAVNFLRNNNIKGPIFNNYHLGNYLIYGLYPREKIFIDARPEMYPAVFFEEYNRMLRDDTFFNQQVAKYHINTVVFGVQMEDPATIRPFLLRLIQSKEWIPIFADGNVTVLIKQEKKNREVIERLGLKI